MEEKITGWVNVKDKLPSERNECVPCYSKDVLCRLNSGLLEICQYDFTNKRWLKYNHLITHWMSIPELKEE